MFTVEHSLFMVLLFQVNFVKEGCGGDNICRSNLKMDYQLFYKQGNLEVYPPLPM